MKLEIENKEESGVLKFKDDILYSLVNLATNEISGVVGLNRKKSFWYKLCFWRNKNLDGVRFKYNENGDLVVDVFIKVYSDINISDVALKVQKSIESNILTMLDRHTAQINVHVVDVVIRKEVEHEDNSENCCI